MLGRAYRDGDDDDHLFLVLCPCHAAHQVLHFGHDHREGGHFVLM